MNKYTRTCCNKSFREVLNSLIIGLLHFKHHKFTSLNKALLSVI